MKSKPLVIRIVGWALVFSPLFYYLQSVLQWQMDFMDFHIFWEYTNFYRIIGIILGPVVGFCVLSVRPIGWYMMLVYALYTIFVNVEVFTRGDVSLPLFILYCFSGLLIILIYVIRKEVMTPYFNPQVRWWENAERYAFNLEVTFHGVDSDEFSKSKTFDISKSGCFIETKFLASLGEEVSFKIKLLEEIETTGQIMWVSDGKGRMPQGLGIRFTSKLKEIKKMMDEFKKQYKESASENFVRREGA